MKFRFGDVLRYENGDHWVVMSFIAYEANTRFSAVVLSTSDQRYWPVGSCDGYWGADHPRKYQVLMEAIQ